MASFEFRDVTFTYPDAAAPALTGISLSVREGEFAVLSGPSGSGKSTLLRLLKRELSPGGSLTGMILLDGRKIEEWPAREAASRVGLVLQHPDNQLVVDTVEHELAFGMENFGLQQNTMRRRMAEAAGLFGLEPLLARRTDELSGGQKQTVNLASILMLQPRLLLLDEPLAQLDPVAARELLGMIRQLNDEWGITVLMSEHRIDDLLPLADRVIRLERGSVVFDGSPRDFAREAWRRQNAEWIGALPSVTRWAMTNGAHSPRQEESPELPLSVKEARSLPLAGQTGQTGQTGHTACPEPLHATEGSAFPSLSKPDPAEALLEAEALFYAYGKKSPAVLRGLEWTIRKGDRLALFGGNGSGKSTLLRVLAGLYPPQRGRVMLDSKPLVRYSAAERYARIGYLAQNPLLHFAYDTLREDLLHAARRAKLSDPEAEVARWAERFGLSGRLGQHPHDLSGGERQLGALALVMLGSPQVLLLDEPTKGIDAQTKARLTDALDEVHRQGVTIVMATHDIEYAAGFANRCSLLFQGEIVADDEPESFFRGNLFYATPLHRLLHGRRTAPAGEEVFR